MATAMKEPTLGQRKNPAKSPIRSLGSAEIAIESTSVHACSLHTKSQDGVHTPPAKPPLPPELNRTFAQSNLRLRNSFSAKTNLLLPFHFAIP